MAEWQVLRLIVRIIVTVLSFFGEDAGVTINDQASNKEK